MAYASSNPPQLVASADDGSTPQLWAYVSADASAVVAGTGYFADANNLGMRVGDTILVSESDNGYAAVLHTVSAISAGAATAGAADTLATTAGVGITAGTGTVYATGVERAGGIIRTSILVDLTGLNSGGTAGDIMGVNGTGAAHLGRITTARNGTIMGGTMTCLEVPAAGGVDIDLYASAAATGVEDTAITAITGTQLINAGNAALGTKVYLSAMPAADSYLYLVNQGTANTTFTGGRLLIELWGV
jgi:hypothetical protein